MAFKFSTRIMLLMTILLASGCQSIAALKNHDTLSGDAVESLFAGHTVESYNLNNSITSHTYYRADGTALQVRDGNRRTGTWKIRNNGEICLDFTGSKCRRIIEEDGIYYKVRKNKLGLNERIIVYKRFSKGNRLGFSG